MRQSLRYAEHLLAQSQQERLDLEAELGRYDERVDEVRKEVREKDIENKNLAA